MSNDYKETVFIIAFIFGIIYWSVEGHNMILDSQVFKDFISGYRGQGFFSIGTLVIFFAVTAAFAYPMVLFILVLIEFVSPGSFFEIMKDKNTAIYLITAPFTMLITFIVLIVATHLITGIVSIIQLTMIIVGPIYLVYSYLREKTQNK